MWKRRARGRGMLVVAGAMLAATLGPVTAADATSTSQAAGGQGQVQLLGQMILALRAAQFGRTIDFGPFEDVCPGASFCAVPARPVKYMPNIDLAIIELDQQGQATAVANVLLSRDYPAGLPLPIDRVAGPAGSYGVSVVRWRRWDIDRYNGGTFSQDDGHQLTQKGWKTNPPLTAADNIVPGRLGTPIDFMAPYPASLFKIIVAFRIMRLVDFGQLSLDQTYTYNPVASLAAEGKQLDQPLERPVGAGVATAAAVAAEGETRTIRDWLDPMITVSSNNATRAMLKLLHDRNDLPAMHAELRGLGLGTLQVNGTDPGTGGNWQPGSIHMTSLDTARLLWLIEGGAGTLWLRPDGRPVLASLLSSSSRSFLKGLLDDQAFHEALSTGSLCGKANVRPGIPALVPARWINPDGTETAGGFPYGQDVRPCNAAAEVVFGHKTGLTFNYGSNAGIVRSLPGKPERRYVIAFNSSLGYRYTDPAFASRSSYPCYDPVGGICYTQRIPAMAKQLDDYIKSTP